MIAAGTLPQINASVEPDEAGLSALAVRLTGTWEDPDITQRGLRGVAGYQGNGDRRAPLCLGAHARASRPRNRVGGSAQTSSTTFSTPTSDGTGNLSPGIGGS